VYSCAARPRPWPGPIKIEREREREMCRSLHLKIAVPVFPRGIVRCGGRDALATLHACHCTLAYQGRRKECTSRKAQGSARIVAVLLHCKSYSKKHTLPLQIEDQETHPAIDDRSISAFDDPPVLVCSM
jgi:hypothetical protein